MRMMFHRLSRPLSVGWVALIVWLGIFGVASAAAPSGQITANPSTVYVQPGQLGSTRISWTTTGCSTAQVYVSTEANPAGQLFAEAPSFTNALANWISQGRVIFSLYANQSRTVLLDEIVVTGTASPLRLPGVLGHGMVLQRNATVPVWGWAEPGQAVQVNFADQTKTATAGGGGKWQVRLDPMVASTNGRAMQVTSGGSSLTLTNVLVGEVWVLSGQSNMEWNLTANGETNAIARADYPWLRTFTIGWPFGTQAQPNLDVYRTSPASDATAPGTQWSVISPANAGHIYTVGFYFAESLRRALGAGVPIGLIQAAVGSTSGECWVGKATRDANPALQYIGTEVWPTPPTNPWFVDKYIMYHAMIAPLQPYGMRGVLWYQGEGNTYQGEPNGGPNLARYRDLLTGLIEGWRRDWNQGSFPFFLVQLPKYGATKVSWDSWERVREAQLQVSQSVPNTGLAISIDTGSADPHPLDKQPIGERLARLARANVHGEAIVPTGPIYAGGTADTNGVNLVFANAGSGLLSTGGSPRTFEVAGADGIFFSATATITGTDTVRLTCSAVPRIVFVRYGWDWSPDVNLFNSDNLPASPFRAEMSGSLSANPSKITLSPGTTGSSTLNWTTSLSPGANVTRSVGGGPEEAIGVTGSMGGVTVSGIGFGKTLFRLYGDAERTRLLDSVEVVGTVAPLTVQSDGSLQLNNRPFTGIGVNYYSAFERVLDNPADTSYEAGFETLGRWGVPFARLDISGYWPSKLNLFFTNRAEYFRRLDGVVACAERHGVGLVPSLFWTTFGMADLAGERLDQMAVSNSVTRQKMREFATEVVNRYKNSSAIWAWEFSNEWNLAFDLPNYHEYLPTYPSLGNPATRDPVRDGISTDTVLPAMVEIAKLIKDLDPGRPISTGHAMSQPFQWHLDQWRRGLLPTASVYTPDSAAQAEAIALRHCPDPFDLLSIHVYGTEPARVADFAGFASRAGKALFVGEFGTPPNLETNYAAMLATVRAQSPLAAVWAFDRAGDEYNITATNARSWMLRALLPAGFSQWSRGWGPNEVPGPDGMSVAAQYIFGAPRPGIAVPSQAGRWLTNTLSLEAVVRTNDSSWRIFGESSATLSVGSWSTNGISWHSSTNQSGVLPGTERRVFSVPTGTNTRKFLRINAQTP